MKKIAIVGVHGTGKSRVCEKIGKEVVKNIIKEKNPDGILIKMWELNNGKKLPFSYISEQFREVVKDIPSFTKQTEEITLATYGKQLYFENLYTAQGRNVLCDRSVLDSFVYYDYFNNISLIRGIEDGIESDDLNLGFYNAFTRTQYKYFKIYLIEPSSREIEDDGFRMTDKKQQYEIHNLFLQYFKDFDNVEIVNQEYCERIVSEVVEFFG